MREKPRDLLSAIDFGCVEKEQKEPITACVFQVTGFLQSQVPFHCSINWQCVRVTKLRQWFHVLGWILGSYPLC